MQTVSAGYLTNIVSSSRQFKPRISFYFDGEASPPTVFDNSDYIKDFSGVEELQKDGEILYNISSNQININLRNTDRVFTPTNAASAYYGLITTGTKVLVELGLWVGAAYEYVTLGTFYTSAWTDSNNKITSVVCNDRLYTLLDKEINILDTGRIRLDISIIDAWRLLLDTLGWTEGVDYTLDAGLTDTLEYFYLNGTYRDVMVRLCQAGVSVAGIGRTGVFTVDILDITAATSQVTFTDSNSIIHSAIEQNLEDTYNVVIVRYKTKGVVRDVLRDLTEYQILLATTVGLKTDKNIFQMESIFIEGLTAATMPTIAAYDWSNVLALLSLDTLTLVNISIVGDYLDGTEGQNISTSLTYLPKEDNTLEFLNELLSSTQAGVLGDALLAIYEDPNSHITSEIKGCPPLEPGDLFTINNATEKIPTQELYLIRKDYKFTGTLNTILTGIKSELMPGGV